MDRDKLSDKEIFSLLRPLPKNMCFRRKGRRYTHWYHYGLKYKDYGQCKQTNCSHTPQKNTRNKIIFQYFVNTKLRNIYVDSFTKSKKNLDLKLYNLLNFVVENGYDVLDNDQKLTLSIHEKFIDGLTSDSYLKSQTKWMKLYNLYLKLFPLKKDEKHMKHYYEIKEKEKNKKARSKNPTKFPKDIVITI